MPTVSIVGFHRSTLGLGEDARTLAESLLELGLRPELVDVSPPALEPYPALGPLRALEAPVPGGDTVVFCLPPGEMARAHAMLGLGRAPAGRRAVGYWPWELSALPRAFDPAFGLVDEVWALSGFLTALYAAHPSRRPVRRVPPRVSVAPPALGPELAALFDGRFTAVSVFDFHSRPERKNPSGAVAAFRRAFPRGDEPAQLVLKTINGGRRPEALARLLAETFADPRVVVVDGAVNRAELCGLVATADVYLSLQRAEGFGRPLAEAMLLGTPVVATRWSGPEDFLDADTGHPVGSHLRPVRPDEYPDAAGCWAEPDVDAAAAHLAALFRDPVGRRRTVEPARRRVEALFGPAAVKRALRAALAG